MSIPTACYVVPSPVVMSAVDRAAEIITRWLADQDPLVADAVCGWTHVALGERIAVALLDAEGRDVDALSDALDDRGERTEGDVISEWERSACRT